MGAFNDKGGFLQPQIPNPSVHLRGESFKRFERPASTGTARVVLSYREPKPKETKKPKAKTKSFPKYKYSSGKLSLSASYLAGY